MKNRFKKGRYKVGDKLKILSEDVEYNRYRTYTIVNVIDKGLYNMYICERKYKNLTYKTTITDKDYYTREKADNLKRKTILRSI